MLGMWLRRDKQAFEGAEHTLEAAEQRQAEGDAPPTRLTRWRRRVSERQVAGLRTWTVAPRRGRPTARVVYVHGGGYVHPLSKDYWRLVRALTRSSAEVVLPGARRTTRPAGRPRCGWAWLKRPCPASVARLRRQPVTIESTATTLAPSPSSRWHSQEPTKPAPPVTTTRASA